MLHLPYDYATCVRSSEKVSWKVDDVMPPESRLDFQRPFLPTKLAGRDRLEFLSELEERRLNQISGNAYLNLFGFVEEFILAMVVQLAHAELFGDHDALRALTRFADEEAKHQQLFHRYIEAFKRDFGYPCEVLGSAAEVASVVLGKSPVGVLLTTLHIELMTQAHYVECVRDSSDIDPFFARLLHKHWLEESQHARIDALELDKLASASSPEALEQGLVDYLAILDAFDGLLRQQAEMDARGLVGALGRTFTPAQTDRLIASQHAGYRRTFLTYGMTNRTFVELVTRLLPSSTARLQKRVADLLS